MKWRKISSVLIAVILMSSGGMTALAHYDTAYWNMGQRAQTRSGWMDWLPDDTVVSKLSLPGTHDSMAWQSNLGDIARTQTMNLYDQLSSGIRVIDIRVKHNGSSFACHHGIIYLGADFEEVLQTVKRFLQENPREAVFMRFSQEQSSASDEEMKRLFDTYYNRYKDIFYQGSSQNPTMGAVRGKLVLISNVLSLNRYGLNYRSLNKQDDYSLGTNWDLYSKWEKVKTQIQQSNSGSMDTIYMNYLSGSGGSFPYFVASGHSEPATRGPRLSTGLTEPGFWYKYPDFPRGSWFGVFATIYFEGTNTLAADYLSNHTNVTRCGMMMADFPGERLINSIINCNERLLSSGSDRVILYKDSNYSGASLSLGEGRYDIDQLGAVGNDALSSIKVPDGYKVILYEHGGFSGGYYTLYSSCPSLGNLNGYDINDIISSVVVEKIR